MQKVITLCHATEKLYWQFGLLEAEVNILSCTQEDEDWYALYLDKTPFHPQGGGQPSDIGWLGDIEVIKVEEVEGKIFHFTKQDVHLSRALAKVDGVKRRLHSQLHSAGHLIGHALETLNWTPIRAHHWPGEAYVSFKPQEDAAFGAIDIENIQQLCDQLIAQNLLCQYQLIDHIVRKVAFGNFPPYGCGGTHVKSTKDLQQLKILNSKLKKGKLTISYSI